MRLAILFLDNANSRALKTSFALWFASSENFSKTLNTCLKISFFIFVFGYIIQALHKFKKKSNLLESEINEPGLGHLDLDNVLNLLDQL